jgi:hypothetical protein
MIVRISFPGRERDSRTFSPKKVTLDEVGPGSVVIRRSYGENSFAVFEKDDDATCD